MSRTRRILNIIGAIFKIQAALFLMFIPEIGFRLIAMFVGFMLTYKGLRYLIYYLTHAQHMVGGKRILLIGLILFDMGVFSAILYDQAQAIMIIYVVAGHLIAAVLNIVRTVGNKRWQPRLEDRPCAVHRKYNPCRPVPHLHQIR